MHYPRMVHITSDQQLAATIFYIHRNPVHHGCCTQIDGWQWSSYQEYMSRVYKWVNPVFVQRFFGTLGMFKQFHDQPIILKAAQVVE
jgi:putative transposase